MVGPGAAGLVTVGAAGSVLAAVGGGIAFVAAVYALIKAQVRQASAVEDNTVATRELTAKLDKLADRVNGHDLRIHSLEDWRAGPGGARWPRLAKPPGRPA